MYFNDDISARMIFDEVAIDYETGRPKYSDEILTDAFRVMGFENINAVPGIRILEIGAGSGQLTEALIPVSSVCHCIEPGVRFARRLRDRFGKSPAFHLFEGYFEAFDSESRFDLVVSACALQWVPKGIALTKTRDLLAPGGWLFGIWNLPRFSADICEHLDALILPEVPELSIPEFSDENRKLFESTFGEFRDNYGYANCLMKIYRYRRSLPVDSFVSLVRSYSGVESGKSESVDKAFAQLESRLAEKSGVQIAFEDVFPVAMGQKQ